MTFSINKKNNLFYYIAIASIVLLLAVFYYNSLVVKSTEALVNHTNRVINKNNEVLLEIVNVESCVRGFALTNKEEFLEPFEKSSRQLTQNLATLLALTKDNPTQQTRIKKLEESINRRIQLSKSLIENQKVVNRNEQFELATVISGKKVMDSIRENINEINFHELQLLNQRKKESASSLQTYNILLIVFFILVVLLLIFIYFIFKDHYKANTALETHNKLQQAASQYSLSLIEASLDPLVTINNEGKITDLNQATVAVTGTNREQLIDSDFFDYFTDHQKAREVYQEAFLKGSVVDAPLTIRHKDGKLTDVLFNGSVYKDELGITKGVVIVARDIAEQKWALDLSIANKELAFQNDEKEKRAAELALANKELEYQNSEKEDRANELLLANEELAFQNQEKENRANELIVANKELEYQNKIKEKKAAELIIANKELAFQNDEKEKRAQELIIANKELLFQKDEKQNRADELEIADIELEFQNEEKEKRVTENKALEASNYSLKLSAQYAVSLIEASRDPLFTISKQGIITDTNNASVNATGVSKEELIGSQFINYFTEPSKAEKGYKEVFLKEFVSDFPLVLKDHKLTDVLFNGSVYRDENNEVMGAVVVARDITEQKRNEKELTEAKVFAELATTIAEDAKIIAEAATAKAEEAVKSKQQFLSNMSHEIRTPMNAIIGFTKVVLKTELTAKQKEYLMAIKLSGDALIVLINDILDLAKVDAGKMTFEKTPFKLNLSIKAMLHLFETKIQEKNLKLITHYDKNIPEILVGDPIRLHQIILNLVSNAVKFTNDGSITVRITQVAERENEVDIHFEIEDTGIGIKENKVNHVFENFQQATSGTSRLFGGTGLGLSIVKQLVQAQNGTINVVSEFGKGSTFGFNLTFMKTAINTVLEPEIIELRSDVKDTKILVVEDMELNQLLMKTILDDFGFECEIAANGKIAVEKLEAQTTEKPFDIILMDLQMPIMNGFEATEYIRKKMKSIIPIIALTADVTTVDVAKCRAVGMDDYISKPVDERLLYSKLTSLMKKPVVIIEQTIINNVQTEKIKYVDLTYLTKITKANPVLMSELINSYLLQTPALINTMKQSFQDKDWKLLNATVHKMLPSFSIMGMSSDVNEIAAKIQEYATAIQCSQELADLVLELENVCMQSCRELERELTHLN